MSEVQPGPLQGLEAETRVRAERQAERAAEARPEFVGDLPDDQEQAVELPTGGAATDESGSPEDVDRSER